MKYFLTTALIATIIACNSSDNTQPDPTPDPDPAPEKVSQKATPNEWSKNAVIYEVNLRQYSEEGTFEAFAKHLPRLKDMGVDILWFMPIYPIGEEKRKGTLGSYYAVKDYMAVNSEHGSLEDFKALVEQIHDMDMYVILDWVANHSAWDNHLMEEHPDWYTRDDEGNVVPPVDDWSDVADFNFEEKGLWDYQIEALKFWVEECDIDGYRCDVADMVPIEFWKQATDELEKVKDVFMLAEAETPELHDNGFDMTYGWEMHHIMNGLAKGERNPSELDAYFAKDKERFPANAYRMHFTSNHDENSWNGTVRERMGDAVKPFAVFSFAIPGMPLIYSGQEAGLDKRLEFFEKDVIEWKESEMRELYTQLIALKKVNPALWNGENGGEMIAIETSDKSVYSFARKTEENTVIAVFNFSSEPVSATISNEELLTGTFVSSFNLELSETNSSVELSGELSVDFEPWGYVIFSK